jgi:hypothetical protein
METGKIESMYYLYECLQEIFINTFHYVQQSPIVVQINPKVHGTKASKNTKKRKRKKDLSDEESREEKKLEDKSDYDGLALLFDDSKEDMAMDIYSVSSLYIVIRIVQIFVFGHVVCYVLICYLYYM